MVVGVASCLWMVDWRLGGVAGELALNVEIDQVFERPGRPSLVRGPGMDRGATIARRGGLGTVVGDRRPRVCFTAFVRDRPPPHSQASGCRRALFPSTIAGTGSEISGFRGILRESTLVSKDGDRPAGLKRSCDRGYTPCIIRRRGRSTALGDRTGESAGRPGGHFMSHDAAGRSTRGLTLVEVLVILAIIVVLIALLLPAGRSSRGAARRAQCTNNLKQLALGVSNYGLTHGVLPPRGRWTRPGGRRRAGGLSSCPTSNRVPCMRRSISPGHGTTPRTPGLLRPPCLSFAVRSRSGSRTRRPIWPCWSRLAA